MTERTRQQAGFGDRLREVRQASGFTQAQTADRCGMSVTNYQKYEHGEMNPTLATAARFAAALGVETAVLFSKPTTRRAGRGRPKTRTK